MLQRNNNSSGLRKRTTDPDENKTWDVAKKLGVVQELNLASEDVRRDFANGVKNAANVVKFKNLDTDHPDVLKYTEALIKKSLAEPIQDETPWVKAMEDAKTALSNSKAKVYQSPSLKNYIQLRQTVNRTSNERVNYDNISLQNKQKQYDEKLTFKEPRLDEISIEKNMPVDVLALKEEKLGDISSTNFAVLQLKNKLSEEADRQDELESNDIQIYGLDEALFDQSIQAVLDNKDSIIKISKKFGLEPEVIGSLIFRERYIRSSADWIVNTATWLGEQDIYGSSSSMTLEDVEEAILGADHYLGAHSSGICSIFPSTAREVLKEYGKETGMDVSKYLDLADSEMQRLFTEDDEFSIWAGILVLGYKAKEMGYIDRIDEIAGLSDEQLIRTLYAYNGDGAFYGEYAEKYMPYIRMIMDDSDH